MKTLATLASALFATAAGAAATRIPVCPGLTIVTAISDQTGDYESIKKIESVTPAAIRLTYSMEAPKQKSVEKIRSARVTRTADLASAANYARMFGPALPETIPGSTSLGTSTAVLKALTTQGEAQIAVPNEGLLATINQMSGSAKAGEIEFSSGTLQRVGRATQSVLVNDVRVDLPVIQTRGEFFGEEAEFAFLDDPENPLALSYTVSRGEFSDVLGGLAGFLDGGDAVEADPERETRDVLRVVKITYSCSPPPVSVIEQSLADTGRVDVYSLFFSFNSDQIREESEPTLKEIAAVMSKHPDWKLSIQGHTDSIASDRFNLELSKRRASAVTDALVKRYGIRADRLAFTGFGESSPKDRNDTLEGRARNRRVELVRQP